MLYDKDISGNEQYSIDGSGNMIYLKDQNDKEIYARDKNGNQIYATNNLGHHIFAKDANSVSYYAKISNFNEIYPKDQRHNDLYVENVYAKKHFNQIGDEYYGKEDGNDKPLNRYARLSNGREIYPKNINNHEFYILDSYCKNENNDEYYAKDNQKNDIYLNVYAKLNNITEIYPVKNDNEMYINEAYATDRNFNEYYAKTITLGDIVIPNKYATMFNGKEIYPFDDEGNAIFVGNRYARKSMNYEYYPSDGSVLNYYAKQFESEIYPLKKNNEPIVLNNRYAKNILQHEYYPVFDGKELLIKNVDVEPVQKDIVVAIITNDSTTWEYIRENVSLQENYAMSQIKREIYPRNHNQNYYYGARYAKLSNNDEYYIKNEIGADIPCTIKYDEVDNIEMYVTLHDGTEIYPRDNEGHLYYLETVDRLQVYANNIWITPTYYAKLSFNGDEYYPKEKNNNEYFIFVFGEKIYAKKSNNQAFFPYPKKYAVNACHVEYYFIDINTNKEVVLQNDNEIGVYAKDVVNNIEIYPKDEEMNEYIPSSINMYAKDSNGIEFYPKTVAGKEYYALGYIMNANNKIIFAKNETGQKYAFNGEVLNEERFQIPQIVPTIEPLNNINLKLCFIIFIIGMIMGYALIATLIHFNVIYNNVKKT